MAWPRITQGGSLKDLWFSDIFSKSGNKINWQASLTLLPSLFAMLSARTVKAVLSTTSRASLSKNAVRITSIAAMVCHFVRVSLHSHCKRTHDLFAMILDKAIGQYQLWGNETSLEIIKLMRYSWLIFRLPYIDHTPWLRCTQGDPRNHRAIQQIYTQHLCPTRHHVFTR